MEKYAIGIDLGGTKIEAAIVSGSGILMDRQCISTESSRGPGQVIGDLVTIAEQLLAKNKNIPVVAIGVGVAGQVEKDTGVVVYAPNLRWRDVHLKDSLAAKFGMPVAICNDVRAAAWGEWLAGAGMGCRDLVCVFVGTGVGGAVICNGMMVDGSNNTAGEIGHIIAKMDGPVCTCGNRGCLEAIAGGWAMQRDARELVRNDTSKGKMLLDLAGGDMEAITARTIVAAALEGDEMANGIIDNAVAVLIAAVTSIVNTIGPKQVIMGGGIIEGMPGLIGRIDKGVKANSLHAATGQVAITAARLHNEAGAIGAALFALDQHK